MQLYLPDAAVPCLTGVLTIEEGGSGPASCLIGTMKAPGVHFSSCTGVSRGPSTATCLDEGMAAPLAPREGVPACTRDSCNQGSCWGGGPAEGGKALLSGLAGVRMSAAEEHSRAICGAAEEVEVLASGFAGVHISAVEEGFCVSFCASSGAPEGVEARLSGFTGVRTLTGETGS